jgi:bacteriocin biosynthesis cyclodehydratase domain-containing protein
MSVRRGTLTAVRPALRPGLLALWRDRDTVQIGVDPRRAVAISGMSQASAVIRLLDGSRERDQLVTEARELGVQPAVTERIITLLAAAGVLVDCSSDVLRSLPPELTRQLMPVLAAASVAAEDGDGGARLIARRSSTTMLVCGSGPIAAIVADLLVRSGLAIRSSPTAPVQQLAGPRPTDPPDLIVIVGHQSPAETAELSRVRLPHLAVYADEAIGVVGPLVQPGFTACLRCIDLAKAERDPAWPLVLAQLAGRSVEPAACDAVLATTVAAQAAAQAVAFADQSPLAHATANGTLELVCPTWQWRRRSWVPHPACSCGSSDTDRRDAITRHPLAARAG